jgi:ubiquinone biosynthesis protein UbiJ
VHRSVEVVVIERGVRLAGDVVVVEKTVKLLTFFDPDGNKLMFYEPWRAQ